MAEKALEMSEGWTVNSQHSFQGFLKRAEELYNDNGYITFLWKTAKQRTARQNDALHVFFDNIADGCNDCGYDMVLSSPVLKSVTIPWTKDSVKERMWRPVQLAMYPKKKSTTQLNRNEISLIAEVITRHLSVTKGLYIPFPSKENTDG